MERPLESREAELINMLEGREIPHVPVEERSAAIRRAIHMLHIGPWMDVEKIVELIGTNEEQLVVHNEPSDPEDII